MFVSASSDINKISICVELHKWPKPVQGVVKFGSIDSHSPMRGHMGHPEASQGDLENQPVL
jgi:hypothetical protein